MKSHPIAGVAFLVDVGNESRYKVLQDYSFVDF